MCYNTKQSRKANEAQNWFKAKIKDPDNFPVSELFNGFEHPICSIITSHTPHLIENAVWGLKPSWATDNWNNNYTLNARIETLQEKPAFKEITNNRCLIIANGFYEWQNYYGQKIKYELGIGGEFFALAGLYDENDNRKSFSIITTEAKGIMKEIHNTKLRMPFAINNLEEMHFWLKGEPVRPFEDFTTIQLDSKYETLF